MNLETHKQQLMDLLSDDYFAAIELKAKAEELNQKEGNREIYEDNTKNEENLNAPNNPQEEGEKESN